MVSLRKINKWFQYITVVFGISGILLVAYIICTSPNDTSPSDTVEVGGDICIVDGVYHWQDDGSLMSYDEFFPVGNEYGKDGEIVDTSTVYESPPAVYWVIPPIQHRGGCKRVLGADTSLVEEPSTMSLLAFLPIFLIRKWIVQWK